MALFKNNLIPIRKKGMNQARNTSAALARLAKHLKRHPDAIRSNGEPQQLTDMQLALVEHLTEDLDENEQPITFAEAALRAGYATHKLGLQSARREFYRPHVYVYYLDACRKLLGSSMHEAMRRLAHNAISSKTDKTSTEAIRLMMEIIDTGSERDHQPTTGTVTFNVYMDDAAVEGPMIEGESHPPSRKDKGDGYERGGPRNRHLSGSEADPRNRHPEILDGAALVVVEGPVGFDPVDLGLEDEG